MKTRIVLLFTIALALFGASVGGSLRIFSSGLNSASLILDDLSVPRKNFTLKTPTNLSASYLVTVPNSNAAGFLSNDGAGNLSWQAAGSGGYTTIQTNGTPITQRATVNLTGAGVSCSDSGGISVCNIPGGGGGSGYNTVQFFGVNLTARTSLNFFGGGVNCADNAGTLTTDCQVFGGASLGLTNLSGVAVNTTLNPGITDTISIGSINHEWYSIQSPQLVTNLATPMLLTVVQAQPIEFITSNLERARILANGQFLIGATTDGGTGAKLYVSGDIYATGNVTCGGSCGGGAAGANQQLSNLSGTVAANLSISPGATNTYSLGVNNHEWFSVQTPSIVSNLSTPMTIGPVQAQPLELFTANTERARITPAGSLLVHKTSAIGSYLEVQGDGSGSALYVDGNSPFTMVTMQNSSGTALTLSVAGGATGFPSTQISNGVSHMAPIVGLSGNAGLAFIFADNGAPTGACTAGIYIQADASTGSVWSCKSGVWTRL